MKTNANSASGDISVGRQEAFTLVDLLAVLAIVALLTLMLVPAKAGAKWRTREAMCAGNLRKLTLTLNLYGTDNDNKLPVLTGASVWAWDLPENTANHQARKRDFYCPSTAPAFTDLENFRDPGPGRNLWDFGGSNFHIVGYIFALSGSASKVSPSNQNTTLLPERIRTGPFVDSPTISPPPNSERELVADVILTLSGNNPAQRYLYNYDQIGGGFYKFHVSAHLNGRIPEGSNIGFKDGHVGWRKFSDPLVTSRTGNNSPYFWW